MGFGDEIPKRGMGWQPHGTLEQIDNKGYLIPYAADGRELVKVGVSFNAEERNIGEWEISEG